MEYIPTKLKSWMDDGDEALGAKNVEDVNWISNNGN